MFQPPERPCPEVSTLRSLPPTTGSAYQLIDPFLQERDDNIFMVCTYMRPGTGADGDEVVVEDHALVFAQIKLFRRWEDSYWYDRYRPLPLHSDDLTDWETALIGGVTRRDNWREACHDGKPCDEGELPTVATRATNTLFGAHAGNLEFYVRVLYIADALPPDAKQRSTAIFRDLVLAAMDHHQRIG